MGTVPGGGDGHRSTLAPLHWGTDTVHHSFTLVKEVHTQIHPYCSSQRCTHHTLMPFHCVTVTHHPSLRYRYKLTLMSLHWGADTPFHTSKRYTHEYTLTPVHRGTRASTPLRLFTDVKTETHRCTSATLFWGTHTPHPGASLQMLTHKHTHCCTLTVHLFSLHTLSYFHWGDTPRYVLLHIKSSYSASSLKCSPTTQPVQWGDSMSLLLITSLMYST